MKDKQLLRFLVVVAAIHALILLFSIPGGQKGSSSQGQLKKMVKELKGSMEETMFLTDEDKKAIEKIKENDFRSFIAKQEEAKKPKAIRVTLAQKGIQKEENTQDEKNSTEAKKCEGKEYEGVGIVRRWVEIEEVAPGYAADKAGLKKGDVILGYTEHSNPTVYVESPDFKGKEGSVVDVFVRRDGRVIKKTLVREKICYKAVTELLSK